MIAVQLEQWYCSGKRADGGPCNRRLADVSLAPGSTVRIRCKYCKTWNTRETAQSQVAVSSSIPRGMER